MKTTEQELQKSMDSLISGLGEMIQNAPETSEVGRRDESKDPGLVREAWGWGRRYCRPIPLWGKRWFDTLEKAAPIVGTGGFVVFVGDRGPGKTQMAEEIARAGVWGSDKDEFTRGDGLIVHKGKTALYRRAMDIFIDLRHAMKPHTKISEKEVLAPLERVGLLVIDEFQERGESDWENRTLKNLLDKRYAAERATIIIANMTQKEVFASLGSSVVDRARENGRSFNFDWPSYRKEIQAARIALETERFSDSTQEDHNLQLDAAQDSTKHHVETIG